MLATAAEAGVAVWAASGHRQHTLEITTGGTIALNSADCNVTVQLDAASTLLLPTNCDGRDRRQRRERRFRGYQRRAAWPVSRSIGGGGTNTLDLEGGGSFNLAAPAALNNIQVVNATEGQAAAEPIIFLRNGTDLTLNLASAATNPQSAGAVVHGADNDDTINLGSGNDIVDLGGTGETVNGGSGNDVLLRDGATIGGDDRRRQRHEPAGRAGRRHRGDGCQHHRHQQTYSC